MQPTHIISVCWATAMLCSAQTSVEYDTIKQALNVVEQRAVSSTASLVSAARPANWRELLIADMQAAITAATTVQNTAKTSTTNSIAVPVGGDFQSALNSANPGDQIILQAGATYTGTFTLPVKTGTAFITITTSAASRLPGEGQRVTPADAAAMPRIVSANAGPAIVAVSGSHHYRFVGVEVTSPAGVYGGTRVQIGQSGDNTEAKLPNNIEFDRVYIHGDPVAGGKRGIDANGKSIIVKNSWMSDFKSASQETQAICAWNTPGPLEITNNRLEAAGMSILIGGAEPALVGVTPADIVISRNYMTKPLSWRSEQLMVKNLFELKAGKRVNITGNIFENVWTASQTGYAILFKPGVTSITPSITADVLFANNIVRNAVGAIAITGNNANGGYTSNITIRNNLFQNIGTPTWSGAAPMFLMVSGPTNISFESNTVAPPANPTALVSVDGPSLSGFVFQSNVVPWGTYGFKASGYAAGVATLAERFPGAVVYKNVFYGTAVAAASQPAGNYFPVLASEVGWVDSAGGNFSLAPTSAYKGVGLSGQDPGFVPTAIFSATATTLAGR